MDYNDYDEYGEPSEDYESMEGFSIVGEDGGELSDADLLASAYAELDGSSTHSPVPTMKVESDEMSRIIAADQYKNAYKKDAKFEDFKEISLDGDTYQFGGVTGQDFLLNKIRQMGYSTQASFRAALRGESLSGKVGIDGLSMEVAVREFERATGAKAGELADRIKLDGSVQPSLFEGDLRTVHSMLVNIEADMQQGPGAKLIGNSLTAERTERREMSEAKAYATLDKLVEMTKGGITGQPNEERYTKIVREKIYAAAINSSAGLDSLDWVPLPNELNMFGSVLTMAPSSGKQGTGFTRTTFSDKFPHLLNRSELGAVDGNGKVLPNTMGMRPDLALEMQLNQLSGNRNSEELQTYLSNVTSVKATYMPWREGVAADERNAAWDAFEADLIEARKVIARQTVTTVDESRGNQTRLNAFGRPYDEQAERANAIDEAFRSGITGDAYAGQPDMGVGVNLRSELTDYLEAEPEAVPVTYADTDQGRYQKWVSENNPPEQGTDAWHRQRSGNVTASQASKLTGGKGTIALAENMALEAMGRKPEFRRNATMQRGNDLEEKAKNLFLRWYADENDRGISWEEAYFEKREDLEGFGVSPDGRLFNEDGSTAGLLEVKVLNHKNLEGALQKYAKQMQLQMAITKEQVTHFWAMDAEGSGDFVYETVYADSEVQEELISAGKMAHELKGRMTTIEEVEASRMARITSKQPRRTNRPSSSEGQQSPFTPVADEVVGTAPAWLPNFEDEVGLSNDGARVTEKNSAFAAAAKRMDRAQAREASLNAEDLILNTAGKTSSRQETAAKKAEAAERKMAMAELAAYAEANKRAANAVNDTTSEMEEFQNSVKKGVAILSELGGLVLAGNDSAMDEVRFAAETGMDVENVRGLRFALQDSKLSDAGASRVMNAAAAQTRVAQDYQAGSEAWAGLMEFRAKSSIESIKNIDFGSPKNYREMNPQARVAWAHDIAQKLPKNERHIFLNAVNMGDLSVSDGSQDLGGARSDFADPTDVYKGATDARQFKQETIEAAGSVQGDLGYAAGVTAVTAKTVGDVASSTTTNALLSAASSGAGAAAVMNANKALTMFTANLGKAGAGLGRLGLLGAAGAAGWMIGSETYEALEGTEAQEKLIEGVGGGINNLLAALGSEDAQKIEDINRINNPKPPRTVDSRGRPINVETTVNIAEDLSVESLTKVEGQEYLKNVSNKKQRRRGPQ